MINSFNAITGTLVSSHRLNSHLDSQVVISVGTLQKVLQSLRDSKRDERQLG